MNENAPVLGRIVILSAALALAGPDAFAQDRALAQEALKISLANIASHMEFETVDLSALKPAPPPPAVRPDPGSDPKATRSFTLDWTSDTVSYLIYAESGAGPVNITLPSGPERPYNNGASASFIYPGADLPVKTGKYGFDVSGSGSDAASVIQSVRKGGQPSSGVLDLNLFVLEGCGLTTTGLQEGLAVFAGVYADAGISLGALKVVILTGASAFLSPGSIEEAEGIFQAVSRQVTANAPNRLAANFFFTKKLSGVYGYSQGIPAALGIPGTSSGGVVVSIDAHLIDTGFDSHEFGLTMAHENGHSMGLYHTSERDGSSHDTISDTPQCSGGDAAGCPDGINIMFWSGHFPDLSTGQAYVLRRSPIVH